MGQDNAPKPSLGFLLLLAVTAVFARPVEAQTSDPVQGACTVCHRDKFESMGANPHSALQGEAWRERLGGGVACVACHGDVTQHVGAGGGLGNVFGFREEPTLVQSERCLSCHSDAHPQFASSAHGAAGMGCTDCHSMHNSDAPNAGLLRSPSDGAIQLRAARPASAVCVDCHEDVFTQFAFNERHRLHEGTLDCTSCHDPHEPAQRLLLGAFKQEACVQCHADKDGPFVFEHPASRVEGCTACHAPHGSPNRHMLTHQRVAELCYGCHAGVPQFHLGFSPVAPPRFDLDTQCTNCHSTIHGSNFDPDFLK